MSAPTSHHLRLPHERNRSSWMPPRIPWSTVVRRLTEARFYWLATTRPDGRPHTVPVGGAWLDDALYFDGSPASLWVRNLAENPAATLHLESTEEVLILDGEAVLVNDLSGSVAHRVATAYFRKYPEAPVPDLEAGVFRFRPRRAKSWTVARLFEDATFWDLELGSAATRAASSPRS